MRLTDDERTAVVIYRLRVIMQQVHYLSKMVFLLKRIKELFIYWDYTL